MYIVYWDGLGYLHFFSEQNHKFLTITFDCLIQINTWSMYQNIDMNLFELWGSIFSSKNLLENWLNPFHPIFSNNFISILYKESMFWLSFPTGNLPTFSLQSATANITFSQESYWCNSILRSPFSYKHSRGRAFYYFEALKAFFFFCTDYSCKKCCPK